MSAHAPAGATARQHRGQTAATHQMLQVLHPGRRQRHFGALRHRAHHGRAVSSRRRSQRTLAVAAGLLNGAAQPPAGWPL